MKKSYIVPNVTVYNVEAQDIICTSPSLSDTPASSTTPTLANGLDFEDAINDLGGGLSTDGDLKFNWE